jgi:hypothetical protein
MYATDLDLELEFTEAEAEAEDEDESGDDLPRAPRPADGQVPGVAWGLAERHDDQDPIAGIR